MDNARLEDAILTNQGAAAGTTRPTAPSLDFDPALAARAWASHLTTKRKEKKQIAVVIPLPSGQQVAVHRMPVWHMLHLGLIPDRLTAYAQNHVRLLASADRELAQRQTVSAYLANHEEEQVNWQDLLDTIWLRCVVSPKFGTSAEATVEVTEEGELRAIERNGDDYFGRKSLPAPEDMVFDVADVELLDKIFVYQFCQGVDESVEQFLRSTSAALGVVADVAGLPLSSV